MTKENFEALLKLEEINQTAIAQRMYPQSISSAKSRLSNKINEVEGVTGKQKLTDKDLEIGSEVFKNLADKIYAKLKVDDDNSTQDI